MQYVISVEHRRFTRLNLSKPPIETVPGQGRPLPPIPAKTPETRLAHGTTASTKRVTNALVADDHAKQSKSDLQMAQENEEKFASISRRNTEDSARSPREELEKAREENKILREENKIIREEDRSLREENKSLSDLLKYRESEANEVLRRETDKYNQLYKTTTTQLEKLRAEKAKTEEIARKTHLKLQAKEEELQKCKDELFDLQPPSQISDVQIGNEWEMLCGNITRWIDDQAGGMGSLSSELKRLKQLNQFTKTISFYWGIDRQELAHHANSYPNIIDMLIRYNIHCLLEETVFHESVYMFGLQRKSAELLTMIENQMSALEPRRGKVISLERKRSKTT